MIISCLSVNGDYAWTGGWDGYLRRWQVADNQLVAAGELEVGSCVNSLVAVSPDMTYAALAGGRVVRVKAT